MSRITAQDMLKEKVVFTAAVSDIDRFVPKIATTRESEDAMLERNFLAQDMPRVMDYDSMPDPPSDGPMLYCESAGNELKFPVRHFCLRGGYLFYFDISDVDDETRNEITYDGPPLGVIPLDQITVEFPPGGRRVFRAHAHTDARNGYELAIVHAPDEANTTRPHQFLVAESMGQRERWAKALRLRSEVGIDTILRPDVLIPTQASEGLSSRHERSNPFDDEPTSADERTSRKPGEPKERRGTEMKTFDNEESDVQMAVREFDIPDFVAEDWINSFFADHNDFDAPAKCRQMEQWQSSIKKGLKGAVLEQYEYFVQASSEMTTMGREVAALRTLVDAQIELIKEMKDIDFSVAFTDAGQDEMELMSSDDEGPMEPTRIGAKKGRRRRVTQQRDDASDVSSVSSTEERRKGNKKKEDNLDDEPDPATSIEVPAWLDDVAEEISAFIKECRYSDASDLLFKTKGDVGEILRQHDEPTERRLTKKQHNGLQSVLQTLDSLTSRMSTRLEESLRRKNEALKQVAKRERADALSLMAPMVSPVCLNDDFIPLQLLVRLGKTQEAANAYSARRSLLLMEALHERPISGTSTLDLVIYSAQLSQSFFSCLANAVEGFLDLFLTTDIKGMGSKDEGSLDESSLQSTTSKNVPPGALSAIVLWCDSELSKFSSAFGGTRILGNLPLSPPPRDANNVISQYGDNTEGNSKERQNAIEIAAQCIDQAFQYASQNLDSIGLPLTPRLAEYLRSRLKGCEAEVARLLNDSWKHLAYDWEMEMEYDDQPLDERRGLGPPR